MHSSMLVLTVYPDHVAGGGGGGAVMIWLDGNIFFQVTEKHRN